MPQKREKIPQNRESPTYCPILPRHRFLKFPCLQLENSPKYFPRGNSTYIISKCLVQPTRTAVAALHASWWSTNCRLTQRKEEWQIPLEHCTNCKPIAIDWDRSLRMYKPAELGFKLNYVQIWMYVSNMVQQGQDPHARTICTQINQCPSELIKNCNRIFGQTNIFNLKLLLADVVASSMSPKPTTMTLPTSKKICAIAFCYGSNHKIISHFLQKKVMGFKICFAANLRTTTFLYGNTTTMMPTSQL